MRRFDCEMNGDWLGVLSEAISKSLIGQERTLLCIDGASGSGKTTIASYLCEHFCAPIIHMDDFFLQPHQRTAERIKEVGGFFDYERFNAEVTQNIMRGGAFSYTRFNCAKMMLDEEVKIACSRLIIVEGVYSMSCQTGLESDISVFFELSQSEQRKRILSRESTQKAERYFLEWIPRENVYFEKCGIRTKCDFVFYNAKMQAATGKDAQ